MKTEGIREDNAKRSAGRAEALAARRRVTMRHAEAEGLIGGDKDARIAGRVSRRLLATAKERAGVHSDTELLEYALAAIALQDQFGDRLFEFEGTVPADVDLEF
jgi:hypothetical protein